LRDFGKLGSQAFSSVYDDQLYQAIRHLSILKADPYTPQSSVEEAEMQLDELMRLSSGPSEMSFLRNLHWWTVEYGLIGDLSKPRIYGAGLLSSIGESYNCLKEEVKKIPYSLDAQKVSFDITTQQPQLFVTPDFEYLNKVLHEFAADISLNKGGLKGLTAALNSAGISTITYSSGLQVSGILSKIYQDKGKAVYLSFQGKTMLAYDNKMIPGHGPDYHSQGFGSPIGFIRGIHTQPEMLTVTDLKLHHIAEGLDLNLEFESGVTIKGKLDKITAMGRKTQIWSFSNCLVQYQGDILFDPSWGTYDMAIGAGITSCFAGASDPNAFGFEFPVPAEKTHKLIHTPKALELHKQYQEVRNIRNQQVSLDRLESIFRTIEREYPEEWLLPLEILELIDLDQEEKDFKEDILRYLKRKAIEDGSLLKLIQDGMTLGGEERKAEGGGQRAKGEGLRA
jgi:phenylalanine-4-hydroxylase